MKKMITGLLTMVMCLAMICPVFAADFVESITYKPAPEVVTTPDENGKKVIGYIRDKDGNILSTEHEDCILITPVSEAESLGEISHEAMTLLLDTYEEFASGKKKLSEVEGLNELAEKVLGEGKNGDDFVIRDFFDITALCDNFELLHKDGNTIDLTFDLGIGADTYMAAMVYVNGEWVLLKNVVNNGDGTVTCTFEDICPVAFLVPGSEVEAEGAPTTGDVNGSRIVIWSSAAIVSLLAIVAVTVIYRRKRSK